MVVSRIVSTGKDLSTLKDTITHRALLNTLGYLELPFVDVNFGTIELYQILPRDSKFQNVLFEFSSRYFET